MRLVMFNLYDYNTDDHVGELIYINPEMVIAVRPAPNVPGATDIYLDGPMNRQVPRVSMLPYEVARELVRGGSGSS